MLGLFHYLKKLAGNNYNLEKVVPVPIYLTFLVPCDKKPALMSIFAGSALGMKDWIRITFAMDIPTLENALERITSFCQRHAKLEA